MVVSCSLDENDCGAGGNCWGNTGIIRTEVLNVCDDIGCDGLLCGVGKGCATAGHADFKGPFSNGLKPRIITSGFSGSDGSHLCDSSCPR